MQSPGWIRIGAVATVCALVGAGAGIAGSGAATSRSAKKPSGTAAAKVKPPGHRGGPGFGLRRGPAVHEESVVLDEAGKKYITVTSDQGVVKSVSGQELTITEGTTAVPYKDVTITVPDDATVNRNGKAAKLADLKTGDQVHVRASSDDTVVFAADDSFKPAGPRGPHGPGGKGPGRGRFFHGGPPPAAPPAPPAPAPPATP